jgi:hypothetical protein
VSLVLARLVFVRGLARFQGARRDVFAMQRERAEAAGGCAEGVLPVQ